MEIKANEKLMRDGFSITQADLNVADRTIEVSISSEKPYGRWFGDEVLCHDPESVDLKRINETGVVLFAHGRDGNFGVMPIGSVKNVWIDDIKKQCRAKIKFDDDEKSNQVFEKVQKGILKGISIGYRVSRWEEVKGNTKSTNGRFEGPVFIATKWEPFEISLEPTPADDSVGVGRTNNDNNDENGGKKLMGEKDPTNVTQTKGIDVIPQAAPAVDEGKIRKEGAAAERSRVSEITALCRQHSIESEEFIKNGDSLETAKTAILAELQKRNAPVPGGAEVVKDEADKFRAAASDGLLIRAGMNVPKPSEGAMELRSMRYRDLAVETLSRVGVSGAHRMNDEELLKRALMPDSQFQGILSNAVNKSLSQFYNEAPTTFQHWTSKGSNSDFKAAEHYRISEAGNLELVQQNGLITYDEGLKDVKVIKKLLTYAKRWGFTREAFINDDLSILSKVPGLYVVAAKRGINKLVYSILANNPIIFDGKNLFDLTHKNLGIGAAVSAAALSEARKLMRTQKDERGVAALNIQPKYLIVPAALETDAQELMTSISKIDASNSGVNNIFRNSLDVVVEAELDSYSEKAWYTAASPMIADTIEVTYLRGQESPTVETDTAFDRLGVDFRIYFDYGVTALDYRGLFKNGGI